MIVMPSRRCFLQLAAATSGALLLPQSQARATDCEEEVTAAQQELSRAFQQRQVGERMVLFTKLIAAYGPGVVSVVEANTISETEKRFTEMKLERRDLSAVKSLLWDNLGEGFDFRCVADSSHRLEYKVTRCFLAEEVAAHGRADLGHAFYCAWDQGFCRGLNPAIRFSRTKTLMAGDLFCNHSYEI